MGNVTECDDAGRLSRTIDQGYPVVAIISGTLDPDYQMNPIPWFSGSGFQAKPV